LRKQYKKGRALIENISASGHAAKNRLMPQAGLHIKISVLAYKLKISVSDMSYHS